MFTGIVQTTGTIASISKDIHLWHLTVQTNKGFTQQLQQGASIAIDGTCLTAVNFTENSITVDVIAETLSRTTLGQLSVGNRVHLERSARVGDEIGGHLLSGHIHGMATLVAIEKPDNNHILSLQIAQPWMNYIFPKGYIALAGVSLTVVDIDRTNNTFSVHLIPETLRATHLGSKQVGDVINIEIDTQTQTIVDTIARIMATQNNH